MFRQIPIEIAVGSHVLLLTPVYLPKGPKSMPIVEFINSIVVKITTNGGIEKWVWAEDPKKRGAYIKVPEWRIVRYTYGGIWLENYKFDQKRIDAQNLNIISQKAAPKAMLGGATKSTNPKSSKNP